MNNSPKNRDSNKIDSCPEKNINIKKSLSNTMINITYIQGSRNILLFQK
jgi:ribosomal protein S11